MVWELHNHQHAPLNKYSTRSWHVLFTPALMCKEELLSHSHEWHVVSSSEQPQAKGASGIPPYACTNHHMPHWLIHFSKASGLFFQHINIAAIPQHTSEPLFNLQSCVAFQSCDYPRALSCVCSSGITDECAWVWQWPSLSAQKGMKRKDRCVRRRRASERIKQTVWVIMGSAIPLRKRVSRW